MIWIVTTGSRKWVNYTQIEDRLRELRAEHGSALQVVNGKSVGGGADLFVEQACEALHINYWPVPVRPDLDGRHKGAPLKRNERMIITYWPMLVVAFRSEGVSNGTDHTISTAKAHGIPVEEIAERL